MQAKNDGSLDWTDEFDKHLERLNRERAPEHEKTAAINTYERLRTATLITSSLVPGADTALLISVFEELCAEAHALGSVSDD